MSLFEESYSLDDAGPLQQEDDASNRLCLAALLEPDADGLDEPICGGDAPPAAASPEVLRPAIRNIVARSVLSDFRDFLRGLRDGGSEARLRRNCSEQIAVTVESVAGSLDAGSRDLAGTLRVIADTLNQSYREENVLVEVCEERGLKFINKDNRSQFLVVMFADANAPPDKGAIGKEPEAMKGPVPKRARDIATAVQRSRLMYSQAMLDQLVAENQTTIRLLRNPDDRDEAFRGLNQLMNPLGLVCTDLDPRGTGSFRIRNRQDQILGNVVDKGGIAVFEPNRTMSEILSRDSNMEGLATLISTIFIDQRGNGTRDQMRRLCADLTNLYESAAQLEAEERAQKLADDRAEKRGDKREKRRTPRTIEEIRATQRAILNWHLHKHGLWVEYEPHDQNKGDIPDTLWLRRYKKAAVRRGDEPKDGDGDRKTDWDGNWFGITLRTPDEGNLNADGWPLLTLWLQRGLIGSTWLGGLLVGFRLYSIFAGAPSTQGWGALGRFFHWVNGGTEPPPETNPPKPTPETPPKNGSGGSRPDDKGGRRNPSETPLDDKGRRRNPGGPEKPGPNTPMDDPPASRRSSLDRPATIRTDLDTRLAFLETRPGSGSSTVTTLPFESRPVLPSPGAPRLDLVQPAPTRFTDTTLVTIPGDITFRMTRTDLARLIDTIEARHGGNRALAFIISQRNNRNLTAAQRLEWRQLGQRCANNETLQRQILSDICNVTRSSYGIAPRIETPRPGERPTSTPADTTTARPRSPSTVPSVGGIALSALGGAIILQEFLRHISPAPGRSRDMAPPSFLPK